MIDRFASVVASPRDAILISDYDGTLAPIVNDPSRATPAPFASVVLQGLSGAGIAIAIVSGRTVAMLQQALGNVQHFLGAPVAFYGLYGFERSIAGEYHVDERVLPYKPAVAQAYEQLSATFPDVRIENKEGLVITAHWRECPNRAIEITDAVRNAGVTTGLDVHFSRMAVELRPPVPIDKGTTALDIAAGFRSVIVAGDDLGDVPAFELLGQLHELGDIDHLVRIAVASDEVPTQILECADITVAEPSDYVALLAEIDDAIRTPSE